jgi:hypothetical protein
MNLMTSLGFRPAFLDYATMTIYPSELAGRVVSAKGTLIAGYERGGFFYTRSCAARAARDWMVVRNSGARLPSG